MVADQPVGTQYSALFLVCEEREDQVAWRNDALPSDAPQVRQHHGVHRLHVDRTSTPDHAVTLDSAEGVHRPIGGARRHHVEVAVHHQPATASVTPGYPHDDARPARLGLDDGRRNPDLTQFPDHVFGGWTFGRPRPIAVVGGVDTDQVTGDAQRVGFEIGPVAHPTSLAQPQLWASTTNTTGVPASTVRLTVQSRSWDALIAAGMRSRAASPAVPSGNRSRKVTVRSS